MKAGQLITDGGVTWMIDDVRDGARVGDIILRPTLRDGYIKANGAEVKREDYPRLVAYVEEKGLWTDNTAAYPGLYGKGDGSTTMVLPDYRGHFLRALDEGRGIDVDRKVGSAQSDEFRSHKHSVDFNGVAGGHVSPSEGGLHSGTGKTQYTSESGGGETRPRNIALIAQIKY